MKDNFDFIEEFRKLDLKMPKCGSWTRASENCEYGDIIVVSKDCYMCFNSGQCQDSYYCEDSKALINCTDCAFCESCELCYECTDCDTLYNCNFCQDCNNCENLNFCFDLRRCKDCIGCCGLRDKQYHIFNQKYSKEEYEKMAAKLDLKNESGKKYIWQKLEEMKQKTPRMYTHQFDTTECIGDYIYHSKNCHNCFDTRRSEDSGYIYQANLDTGTRDCYDCGPIPTGMDICYDIAYSHYLFNCKHIYWCGNLKDSEYCVSCFEGRNLFGCNYLKNKDKGFRILNEEVSEEFFRKKTAEIKQELREKGIYTLHDLLYKDLAEPVIKISDNELDRNCLICKEAFTITQREIAFYKKMKIDFPVYCPECRSNQRYKLRNERTMHKRSCDSCKKNLITTFSPDSSYKVVCLDCYWENIG